MSRLNMKKPWVSWTVNSLDQQLRTVRMTLYSTKSSKIPRLGQIQESGSHQRRWKSSPYRTFRLFIKYTPKSRLLRKTWTWVNQQASSSLFITRLGSASRWKTWSQKSLTWSRTSRLQRGQARQLSTSHPTLVQTRTAHGKRWRMTVTDAATSHLWTNST